jgi:hypothetical protein
MANTPPPAAIGTGSFMAGPYRKAQFDGSIQQLPFTHCGAQFLGREFWARRLSPHSAESKYRYGDFVAPTAEID